MTHVASLPDGWQHLESVVLADEYRIRVQTLRSVPNSIRNEYARIQTFDDDYAFAGSVAQRYRQIGNAVPVLLAYRVGARIVEFLERHARSAPALVEA